jgi:hypothetical protein
MDQRDGVKGLSDGANILRTWVWHLDCLVVGLHFPGMGKKTGHYTRPLTPLVGCRIMVTHATLRGNRNLIGENPNA